MFDESVRITLQFSRTELRICVLFCVLEWFAFFLLRIELGVEAIATEPSLQLVLLFEPPLHARGRLRPRDYFQFYCDCLGTDAHTRSKFWLRVSNYKRIYPCLVLRQSSLVLKSSQLGQSPVGVTVLNPLHAVD
jgi:hypothetical protein